MAKKYDDIERLKAMLGGQNKAQPVPPRAVAKEVSHLHDISPISSNQVIHSKEKPVDPLDHTVLSQDKLEGRLVDASAPGTVLGLPKARNGNKEIKLEEPKVALTETPNQKQLFIDIDDDYVRHFLLKMSDEFASLGVFNVNYSIRFENNSLSVSSIDFLDAEFKKISGLSENRQFSENVIESLNARLAVVERKYLIPLIKSGLNILESGELSLNVEPKVGLPFDLNKEIEIKAPSIRMTHTDVGKNNLPPKTASNLNQEIPGLIIELGNFYNVPDKNGYIVISKGVEYHIKLENEDDFSFTFNLNKRLNDSQEINEVARERFNKGKRLHQFKEACLDIELLQKGGKWIFAITEWDAHLRHKSILQAETRLDLSSKWKTSAIVAFGMATSIFFLPQISAYFRDLVNPIIFPDPISTAPIINEIKISLNTYLSIFAGILTAVGSIFLVKSYKEKNKKLRGD